MRGSSIKTSEVPIRSPVQMLPFRMRRGRLSSPPIWLNKMRATRSEEHTSELQSLMRISYAVFCLKKQQHNISLHNPCVTYHNYYLSVNPHTTNYIITTVIVYCNDKITI